MWGARPPASSYTHTKVLLSPCTHAGVPQQHPAPTCGVAPTPGSCTHPDAAPILGCCTYFGVLHPDRDAAPMVRPSTYTKTLHPCWGATPASCTHSGVLHPPIPRSIKPLLPLPASFVPGTGRGNAAGGHTVTSVPQRARSQFGPVPSQSGCSAARPEPVTRQSRVPPEADPSPAEPRGAWLRAEPRPVPPLAANGEAPRPAQPGASRAQPGRGGSERAERSRAEPDRTERTRTGAEPERFGRDRRNSERFGSARSGRVPGPGRGLRDAAGPPGTAGPGAAGPGAAAAAAAAALPGAGWGRDRDGDGTGRDGGGTGPGPGRVSPPLRTRRAARSPRGSRSPPRASLYFIAFVLFYFGLFGVILVYFISFIFFFYI